MQKKHALIVVGLALFLLLVVSVDFFKLKSKESHSARSSQKTDLAAKVDEIGQVLSGSAHNYIFLIKDSSNNSAISDATVAANTSGCVKYTETGYYHIGCSGAGLISVTVTKSGYKSKTTNIAEYSGDNPDIIVLLEAGSDSSGNSTTTTTTTNKSTTTTTAAAVPGETVKSVPLPSEFGTGKSTDLSTITDLTKVENLVLDTSLGAIKFTEVVDLSGADVAGKFRDLNDYIEIVELGVVRLDSEILPFLNKPATVTMKKLPYVKTPRVLVDGKEDKKVVTNIKYKEGELTFEVKHFSTFIAAPTVGIEEPADKFEVSSKTIKLKGTVSDPTASVSAKLNNKDLGKLKVASSGAYEKEIDLVEGDNKIVVSALSENLASASASVSGVLKQTNLAAIYALLGFLAVLGIGGLVFGIRHLRKKKTNSASQPNQTPPS